MISSNLIPLDALSRLPMAEIASLPAEELARLQKEADAALRQAKLILACLDGALTQKYADRAKAARADVQKDFGVARFQDGAVTVVADLSKKVEWNQGKLAGLVDRIKSEGEDPHEYVEITYRVAERNYTSWPLNLRSLFQPARTVRPGKESFELIVDGEGV
ncbi:MAG: hypothetical protein B7Y80_18715 [Hyphomicrobium sp. 32-62-53]|nr:MAG: hypothetical protein B7Z29_17410 [Hyphomicrobium sp. 12-62-95]OYX97654.1 MAG: hypothetical protein B7Y80_18715 [Hyphomicrobium sp. 32-62-53]